MGYNIRQSQVVHTWPAGSMVDFPQLSLMMLSFDHGGGQQQHGDWGVEGNHDGPNEKIVIRDNRLSEAFNVELFLLPPVEGVNNILAIKTIRFPGTQYCPNCGLIHNISKDKGREIYPGKNFNFDQGMKAFYCQDCFDNQTGRGPALVPMRFVIATEEGFIDDFPWDWFVHKNVPQERKKNNKLYFEQRGGSASLYDITIISKNNAGNEIARRNLGDIFDQRIFTEICPTHGHYLNYVDGFLSKPWKGWHDNRNYKKELVADIPSEANIMNGEELSDAAKRKFPRTMQRGAGNIIFPIVYSGILLPEKTYEIKCPVELQTRLERAKENIVNEMGGDYSSFNNDDWREYFINQLDKRPNYILLQLGYSKSEVASFIISHFGENSSNNSINKFLKLRQQEFKAFTGNVCEDSEVWFKKKSIFSESFPSEMQAFIEEIVLMEKISALKVYRGFTRVKPLMNEELTFANSQDNLQGQYKQEFERIQDARIDPIATRELPAVEVKGEGIFLRFKNEELNNWCQKYPDDRINTINNNLVQANCDFNQAHPPVSKRYLLLHSFSHIILKELAEDCGYGLTSLSEIIYCSDDSKIGTDEEMNGILIYTTTADAEGSLGGLVEKGKPEYLSSIIKKGIDNARWCSADPLCISTENGQGFLGLNLAACYSCLLLPETTCEKMNKYLDRATLVGTLISPEIGFFT
jgi:hypothetical protein